MKTQFFAAVAFGGLVACGGADGSNDVSSSTAAFSSDPTAQQIQAQGADSVALSATFVVERPQHHADGGNRPLHPSDDTTRRYCEEFGLVYETSETFNFGQHENVSKYTPGGGWDKNSNPTYVGEIVCDLPFNGGGQDVNDLVNRIRQQGANQVTLNASYVVTSPRHRADGATRLLHSSDPTADKYCDEFGLRNIGYQIGSFGQHENVSKYTPGGGWDKDSNPTYIQQIACARN